MADLLLHHERDVERSAYLLHLLPLLDPEDRAVCADAVFARPQLLQEMNLDHLAMLGPVVVATGYASRVLDAIESEELPETGSYFWLVEMAPHLSRAEVERALEIFGSYGGEFCPRRWLLAGLAQFGIDDAHRALDLLYARVENEWLSEGGVAGRLRAYVSDDHHANGKAEYGKPWWERLTYPGVVREWKSGVRRYRRRPRYVAPLSALLDGLPKPFDPQTLIDVIIDTAGSVVDDEVPILLDLAEQIDAESDEPWNALTLLAAGMHLPPGRGYDVVVDEIVARLRTLRDQSLSKVTTVTIGGDGFPSPAPWLVRGIGGWTPLFVRVLAPKARAAVRPVLFDDGYLDGVLRSHRFLGIGGYGDKHDRLDDWAHDVLTLTPVLEVTELNQLRVTGRAILSESTRKAFEAGLAVGYAAHGEMTVAYELIRGARLQTEAIRTSVLADLVTQIPSHALPEWLAQVHLILGSPYDRGPLWAIMNDRWPELTREQLWEVLDRWTSKLPHNSRFGVCADILHYKYAVRALSGPQECERILDLLGIQVVRR